jgi:hypothetical protein
MEFKIRSKEDLIKDCIRFRDETIEESERPEVTPKQQQDYTDAVNFFQSIIHFLRKQNGNYNSTNGNKKSTRNNKRKRGSGSRSLRGKLVGGTGGAL